MTDLVTVPLPTIVGREDLFGKAVTSYQGTIPDVEILVYENYPTCGKAWLEGIQEGRGDYFLMGADDVEMHPGFWQAAKSAIDLGYLPAARILNTDGTLQSCGPWETEVINGTILTGGDFTRSPCFSRAQWEKLEPLVAPILGQIHYYTDNVFTWAGRLVGMETVIVRQFEYTHHLAEPGRGAGMTWNERMQADYKTYTDYIGSV